MISIHAPRGGSDCRQPLPFEWRSSFQSTLPVGGATSWAICVQHSHKISIHAPRGGSDHAKCVDGQYLFISIHAPRGGSDRCAAGNKCELLDFNPRSPWGERLYISVILIKFHVFQSTLPVGGATARDIPIPGLREISIHAPRGGSDLCLLEQMLFLFDFNPRSPWGERRYVAAQVAQSLIFQSTLPVGGATLVIGIVAHGLSISIHAPRGGSDSLLVALERVLWYFNPRSPWGERRNSYQFVTRASKISIHAPRGGSD